MPTQTQPIHDQHKDAPIMNGPILPGEDLTTVRNIPTRTKTVSYQYSAFYDIKQKGDDLITLEKIAPA